MSIPEPVITGVSPNTGPASGGTVVHVTGSNFTNADPAYTVNAAGISGGGSPIAFYTAELTVVSDTEIIFVTSPANWYAAMNVFVSTSGGGFAALEGAFTYIEGPSITLVSPAEGPASGGTSVAIYGLAFTGATEVLFGGESAEFTVVNFVEITAITPPGSGTVEISITAPGGTTTGSSFTYIGAPTVTSVSPSSGPTGITVVIHGTNFADVTAVEFGGAFASFTVNSITQITATAPLGTGTVDITVTNVEGTSATSSADQYTYTGTPQAQCVASAILVDALNKKIVNFT